MVFSRNPRRIGLNHSGWNAVCDSKEEVRNLVDRPPVSPRSARRIGRWGLGLPSPEATRFAATDRHRDVPRRNAAGRSTTVIRTPEPLPDPQRDPHEIR
ncbi:MAG TPA: hypothetical protein DER64_01035 [Planctomycetaceae bacterium]|nr:hypothetical protein [Planctomycetaceae bacterium]